MRAGQRLAAFVGAGFVSGACLAAVAALAPESVTLAAGVAWGAGVGLASPWALEWLRGER